MTTKTFTRQQLYDLVWQTPMRKLAASFELSDVALAKHCKKAGIPLPGLGYWAKKEADKAPPQPPLPQRALAQHDTISFGSDARSGYPVPPEEIVKEEIPPPPVFEGDLNSIRERARKIVGTVTYPSLAKPHPAIAKLLEEDARRRAKQAASSWPSSWDAPFFDSAPEKRRLRIMNALFLALARCGCRPWNPRKASYDLGALIGDVSMGFVLAPVEFNRGEHDRGKVFENKGKLMLELAWYEPPTEIHRHWKDRDELPLEAQLTDIMVSLLVASEWALREHAKRSHAYLVERKTKAEEELIRREEEPRRKEQERLDKIARERRERLFSEAEALRQATAVRAYVTARREFALIARGRVDEELETWAQWALSEADRIDPLGKTLDKL